MSRATFVAFSRRLARSLPEAAWSGLSIGIATGLVAATVDAIYGALNPFSGGLVALVLSIFALLVPLIAGLGALLAGWLALATPRGQERKTILVTAATSALASQPLL
jgi:hypothetical protein